MPVSLGRKKRISCPQNQPTFGKLSNFQSPSLESWIQHLISDKNANSKLDCITLEKLKMLTMLQLHVCSHAYTYTIACSVGLSTSVLTLLVLYQMSGPQSIMCCVFHRSTISKRTTLQHDRNS